MDELATDDLSERGCLLTSHFSPLPSHAFRPGGLGGLTTDHLEIFMHELINGIVPTEPGNRSD